LGVATSCDRCGADLPLRLEHDPPSEVAVHKGLIVAALIAVASACSEVEQTPPDRSYFYEGATRLGDPGAPNGYVVSSGDQRAPRRYRRLVDQ
jgi:hypothetical protein